MLVGASEVEEVMSCLRDGHDITILGVIQCSSDLKSFQDTVAIAYINVLAKTIIRRCATTNSIVCFNPIQFPDPTFSKKGLLAKIYG